MPIQERLTPRELAELSQADRIIARFGNARDVSRALDLLPDQNAHRQPAAIYKWSWKGFIPAEIIPALRQAGRLVGVNLTAADLYGTENG